MKFLKRFKIYLIPVFFLILPGLVGLFFEAYNHFYRGASTPFFYPSLGLLLLSLFFWAKNRWIYLVLIVTTAGYLFFSFRHYIWLKPQPVSIVHYYQKWSLDTYTGRIHLKKPLGKHPPSKGPYISCNFSLQSWKSYLNNQPTLCTAFDKRLRLQMFLHDQMTGDGQLREFHINEYQVDRKSLLGEPLDRSALRIAFSLQKKGLRPQYRVKAIYQVYEREVGPGKSKIVESFARGPTGKLKNFTESPLLKFTNRDVYAVYDSRGILVEIPRMRGRSFSFPAKIDVRSYRKYDLPKVLRPGGRS